MNELIAHFKCLLIKVCLSFPLGVFILTDRQIEVTYALFMMVIIDTILGVCVAIKYKKFCSYKLGRLASKIGRYGLALTSVWIISSVEPSLFGWTFSTLGIFLVFTELLSNLEKLSLLGMVFPTNFLARLNEDFKKIQDNNGEKEKSIKKVMDKK